MNHYEIITIKDADEECPRLCNLFDGFGDFNDYVVINMNKQAQHIGKEIIDNLENGQPHDEALISIETKSDIIIDQIRESLMDKVFEYVEENW